MKRSNKNISGSVRLLILLGLLIIAAPLAANAQTKDQRNESATNAAGIVEQSETVAAVDPGPGFKPFQTVTFFTQQPGVALSPVSIVIVPAGKRLVIEFINYTGQVPAGQRVVAFNLAAFGGAYSFLVNEQPAMSNGDVIFRAAQQLRLYVENSAVQTLVVRSSAVGTATYQVAISGYFEDVN